MAKKGLLVWLFSSLAVIALAHLVDATSALILSNPIKLLSQYPLIGERLQSLEPVLYFWTSVAVSLLLWSITCAIAFENPVETFLNKILSDAKTQGAVESQLLESKSEILDAMFETMESGNETLAQVKDLVFNIRTEAKEIPSIKESMEKVKTELIGLKKEVRKIEERDSLPIVCTACGKPLRPDFRICPYCGQEAKSLAEMALTLKEYR